MAESPPRTAKATETHLRNAAHRAVDDPVALARAARIVRAALARQRLTVDELTPLPPSTPDVADSGGGSVAA